MLISSRSDDICSFWPIIQQCDSVITKFWDPPQPKSNYFNPILLFEGELTRIGTTKKQVKSYIYEVDEEGIMTYKLKGQRIKGQLKLNSKVFVIAENDHSFLKIKKFSNVFITLMSTDSKQLFNCYDVLKMFCASSQFLQHYNVISQLGCGAFGQVFKVENNNQQKQYAAKVYHKEDLQENKFHDLLKNMIIQEVEVLQQIKKSGGHSNIVEIHEIYQDIDKFIIIQELLKGQDLYELLKIQKRFSEQKAASIILQISKALKYLHNLGFVHRDIKLDNIIYASQQNDTVKLIDFGFAEKNSPEVLTSRCGTPGYVAPEVLKKQPFTEKSDVFSLGVVLFTLITGKSLFKGETVTQLLNANKKSQPKFDQDVWQRTSKECLALVKKMLIRNPSQRYSLDQVLNDDWFKSTSLKQSLQMNCLKQSLHSSYHRRMSSKNALSSPQSMMSVVSSNKSSNGFFDLDVKGKMYSLMITSRKTTNNIKIQSQSQDIFDIKDDEEIREINQSVKRTKTLVEKKQDYQDCQTQTQTIKTVQAQQSNSQDLEIFDNDDDDDSLYDRHLVLFRHAERVFNRNKKPQNLTINK